MLVKGTGVLGRRPRTWCPAALLLLSPSLLQRCWQVAQALALLPPQPHKWQLLEIVNHLVCMEPVMHQAFVFVMLAMLGQPVLAK